MAKGLGKTGAIIAIISNCLTLLRTMIAYLFGGYFSYIIEEVVELQESGETFVNIFIAMLLVITVFSIVLTVISLILSIIYLKTGKYRIATGVLNIIGLNILSVISGILILVNKDDQDYKENQEY